MANGIIVPNDYDTGWVELNANLSYRRINEVVYLKIRSQSDSTGVEVGNLPVGIRPETSDVYTTALADNYISPIRFWEIQILRTGKVVSWSNTGFGLYTIVSYII